MVKYYFKLCSDLVIPTIEQVVSIIDVIVVNKTETETWVGSNIEKLQTNKIFSQDAVHVAHRSACDILGLFNMLRIHRPFISIREIIN